MNVRELIKELENMDPEAGVHFSYNYGDYWRTIVAPKVCRVKEGLVEWSEYHSMPSVVDEEKDFDPEDAKEVVIIS